jgi:acetyl-CoA acyltransferase
VPPIAEPYSGKTLAYYAETMMSDWGVSRADADLYTAQSHQRAGAAADRIAPRLLPVDAPDGLVDADDLVRPETTPEILAGLPMVHPELGGGVSPGNASRLTDGAGGVLLATERWSSEAGVEPQGWIRGWALTAHDPDVGVLLGPAHAIPSVLERTGLRPGDIDVWEFHEAFAGQVLANLAALGDRGFAREHLGRDEAVTQLATDDINAWGGSIPLGHPFGATGARLITQTLDRLDAEDGQLGLLALCVGGTRGAAMIVERA